MALIFENGRSKLTVGVAVGFASMTVGNNSTHPPITDEMSASSPDDNFIDAILGRAESRTSR